MDAKSRIRTVLVAALLIVLGIGVSHTTRGAASVALPDPVKLNVPSTVVYGDSFGNSLAVDGDFMVVGAWRTNVGANEQQGVVYLFAREASDSLVFNHVKTLTAADSYAFQGFGTSVAIHGDTIVVGAIHDDPDGHFDAGAAYVFQRNHGGADAWGEVAKLVDVNFNDEFSEHGYLGQSVAIHGDLIVAGAPRDRGRTFVFGRNQGGADQWGEVQVIGPGSYWELGSYGVAVATDGQRIVVGATRANMVPGDVFSNEGAAFVYEHDGSKWIKVAKLAIADEDRETTYGNDSRFGGALAIQGERVFVGATGMTINDVYGIGEVYLFQRNSNGEWPLEGIITAESGGAAASFGRALYAVNDGLFVSSDTGLDGNGMVHFFRYAGEQSVVNAGVAPNLQSWTHIYSFTTTEDVEGSNVGSELAGSGNLLAIGANGYDGGRGSVFTYPMDVMLAVDPQETPTETPPTEESPTPDPNALVYLPVVASTEVQLPTQLTGMLANNGIFAGPGGVKIGAVANTLTTTFAITMAATAAPSEPLPNGIIARSDYFRLSGERTLLVDMDSPFVMSVPVPAGMDTTHLALAALTPAEEILDSTSATNEWAYLPGVYDAAHGLFLTQMPVVGADGMTLVLVEHPDLESPLNEVNAQIAADIPLRPFAPYCAQHTFPDPNDCMATTVADAKVFLDTVYRNMVEQYGFPAKLRLLNADSTFIVSESYSVTAQSATYSVAILHNSDSLCDGNEAAYVSSIGFLFLCLGSGEVITDLHKDALLHELFHAIQFSYPKVLRDHEQGRNRKWITEGMAMAAMESYYSTTMARSFFYGEDNLHRVDIQLTTGAGGDEYVDEYLAQDFWVYVGQSKPDNLRYLGPILAIGGATTQGVADAMKAIDGSDFGDLYWGWVKNQVIENTYSLGGGPGQVCHLTDQALTDGQHTSFPSHFQYYPPFNNYEYLAPLSATVIEILIPHTDTGLIVNVLYEDCAGITDPVALGSCRVAAQQYLHAKIYEEGETNCKNDQPEGYRFLQSITPGKRYFVVLANADIDNEHGFAIALE